jgi:hypothetical protein
MRLSVLHKTAFLANLCLGLALLLRAFPILPDSSFKSGIIVLGYIGSYFINTAAILLTAWSWYRQSPDWTELSPWPAVMNAVVFGVQLVMLLL